MPRITVIADDPSGRVLHSERVTPTDFETEHFRAQLAERVAWAVEDAEVDAGYGRGGSAASGGGQRSSDARTSSRWLSVGSGGSTARLVGGLRFLGGELVCLLVQCCLLPRNCPAPLRAKRRIVPSRS